MISKKLFLALSFLAFTCASQAQTFSGCLAHHPQYIAGQFEATYSSNCTGHDEPELDPLSSAPGSARDLTWTAVLPTDGRHDVPMLVQRSGLAARSPIR